MNGQLRRRSMCLEGVESTNLSRVVDEGGGEGGLPSCVQKRRNGWDRRWTWGVMR
jgi:hypothetical protein